MAYEERTVVESDPAVDRVETAEPATVIERRPTTTYVHKDDPIASVFAASQLIQTIVWAVVVLVLLVVALMALHVYAHLF